MIIMSRRSGADLLDRWLGGRQIGEISRARAVIAGSSYKRAANHSVSVLRQALSVRRSLPPAYSDT